MEQFILPFILSFIFVSLMCIIKSVSFFDDDDDDDDDDDVNVTTNTVSPVPTPAPTPALGPVPTPTPPAFLPKPTSTPKKDT